MAAAQAALFPEANGVRLQRWPKAPALIEPLPASMASYPDLAAMAARIVELLNGREPEFSKGRGAMAEYDTFPMVTVWAKAANPAANEWLGGAVLLSPNGPNADLDQLQAAVRAALPCPQQKD